MPARCSAGNEHVIPAECPRRRQQPALPDGARDVVSARACSRTSRPSRNSRHRDRRPSRQGSGRAAPWPGAARPSLSGGSGHEAAPLLVPAESERRARPLAHSASSHSSKRTERSATAFALRRSSAASRIWRVLPDRRQAARFEEHDRLPAFGERKQSIGILARAASSLVEETLRDQRPAAADVRRERHAVPEPLPCTSSPAMPTDG